ncbi:MAG: DNA topoisomerase, partial [Clostridia bacterium]|nr:DNA topoisomerase [Clostridia bacterium]
MAVKKVTEEKTVKEEYGNQSITQLKGADRVRKRPAVIFGSDGLEGCQHAVFEIVSNSVDEAREGYGDTIVITRFADHSVQVEDSGRGVPMGYNEREKRYNWDLIFCELYAGGKYENNKEGANYGYALGLNGLGACATQCASAYMEVRSYSGGMLSEMHFKKGKPSGKLKEEPLAPRDKKHGTIIKWLPDLEVFTDIAIPKEYYVDMLKRQAVVNSGVRFVFKNEVTKGKFETEEFYYENGITDRVRELAGGTELIDPTLFKTETMGRDREDMDDYKLKVEFSFCISNKIKTTEYYHNSSWLEHGGSPEKAARLAFVSAINKYIKNAGKYKKGESQILFADVAECLVL